MKKIYKDIAVFVGGTLFGSAGIKLLSSKDAKNVYTHAAAAVLRMKDTVMNTVDCVKENAGDILASAEEINEKRAAEAEAAVEDADIEVELTDEDPTAARLRHKNLSPNHGLADREGTCCKAVPKSSKVPVRNFLPLRNKNRGICPRFLWITETILFLALRRRTGHIKEGEPSFPIYRK